MFIFKQHTHKTVQLLKMKYDYTKTENLKISKSVNLSPVNQERVFPTGYLEKGVPYGLPPIFLFRHALMPRFQWSGTSCGYLWFLLGKVRE